MSFQSFRNRVEIDPKYIQNNILKYCEEKKKAKNNSTRLVYCQAVINANIDMLNHLADMGEINPEELNIFKNQIWDSYGGYYEQ